MCLIAFVLGYFISRMMRGNGLSVGGECKCPNGTASDDPRCDNSNTPIYMCGSCNNGYKMENDPSGQSRCVPGCSPGYKMVTDDGGTTSCVLG